MKASKTDIASFLLGLSQGLHDKGNYVQMKHKRQIECHQKGVETAKGIEQDLLKGNAPGLSFGDYIDVALQELGALTE